MAPPRKSARLSRDAQTGNSRATKNLQIEADPQDSDGSEYGTGDRDTKAQPAQATRQTLRSTTRPGFYLEVGSDAEEEDEFTEYQEDVSKTGRPVNQIRATKCNESANEFHGARRSERKAADDAYTVLSGSSKAKVRKTSGSKISKTTSLPHDATASKNATSLAEMQLAPIVSILPFVEGEINRLKTIIPDWKQLRVVEAPQAAHVQPLPHLQSTLIEAYRPKEGKIDKQNLLLWLRSASVLPIVRKWVSASMQTKDHWHRMKAFLPMKEYPWPAQLERVTALAKRPDSGRSQDAPEAVLLCAIYTRKLFLCNHSTLLKNGTRSADFIWHRILDIPCAVVFTVFHDVVTGGTSFFRILLRSPLALPMHSDIREVIERDYPLPTSSDPPTLSDLFFIAAAGSEPGNFLPPPAPPGAVDHHAYCEYQPFTDKEQLAFWLAYRDRTRPKFLFGIDFQYVGELLPGRCEQEIAAFYKLNKANLGLQEERRVVIARTGDEPASEDLEADEEGEGAEEDSYVPAAGPVSQRSRQLDALVRLSISGLPRQASGAQKSTNGVGLYHKPAVQPSNTAGDHARGFASLQAYVPPRPPAPQPPLPRTNLAPAVLAQVLAVDQAWRERNEADLALAERQVDLEDKKSEAGEGGMDSLKVQMAWYERDEANALLEGKQGVLSKALRELVVVGARCNGDCAKEKALCEKTGIIDLESEGEADGEGGEEGKGQKGGGRAGEGKKEVIDLSGEISGEEDAED